MGECPTVAGRGLAVLVAAGVVLAVAPPAIAAKRTVVRYEHGTDVSTWYWERQQDREVAPPPPPEGFPEAPVAPSQRIRLPSPQRPDTLPVALWQGDHERMSALKFDVAQRGVVAGSRITSLILEIEESEDRNDSPQGDPAVSAQLGQSRHAKQRGGEQDRVSGVRDPVEPTGD